MTTRQKQDLSIFSDGSIVSSKLLNRVKYSPFLGLITSIEGTNPIWLANTLIEELLFGRCRLNSHAASVTNLVISESLEHTASSGNQVIYVSFSNNLQYHAYYFQKSTGIDLTSNNKQTFSVNQAVSNIYQQTLNGKFHFINCFDNLFSELLKNDVSEASIDAFFEKYIVQKVGDIVKNGLNTIVIVENPELLLASTLASPFLVLQKIHKIQKLCQGVVVVLAVDEPLINFNSLNNVHSIEFKTTKLYSHLLHRSNVVINVKPLSTGRADDISGNLSISKGMVDLEFLLVDEKDYQSNLASLSVTEKEYLFHVKKDSTVDLFYK